MRYQINKGGELDRREVESEEQTRAAAFELLADCPYLAHGDIIRVVDTLAPNERTVRNIRDGSVSDIAVRPYKTSENKIDGAVIVIHKHGDQ